MTSPELSVIIPFFNEVDVAGAVLDEVLDALSALGRSFELIVIDDGSSDSTLEVLTGASRKCPSCRVLRHDTNLGQAAALWNGVHAARGSILMTLDGDGQNDPGDFGTLLAHLDVADMVVGVRVTRRDSLLRRYMSLIANSVRTRWLSDGVKDSGCALKAFRREVIDSFMPIKTLYSFMPAFAISAGYRVSECPVNHRQRVAGESKYGLRVMLLRPLVDMLAVGWMIKRQLPRTPARELESHHSAVERRS